MKKLVLSALAAVCLMGPGIARACDCQHSANKKCPATCAAGQCPAGCAGGDAIKGDKAPDKGAEAPSKKR